MSTPNVTIFFNGLMFFTIPNDYSECRVGLHTKAHGHEIKISVVKKSGDQIIEIATYCFRHDQIREHKDLWFYVPGTRAVDVQFNSKDEEAFENVLNLEGPDIFDQPLTPNADVLTPTLHILNATMGSQPGVRECLRVEQEVIEKGFFIFGELVSESRLDESLENFKHEWQYKQPCNLGELPERTKAELTLASGQSLHLATSKDGKDSSNLIPPITPGADSYEIYFENLPPGHGVSFDQFDTQPPHSGEHEHAHPRLEIGFHFAHYYTAFELKPGITKYAIVANRIPMGVDPAPPCNEGRGYLPEEG